MPIRRHATACTSRCSSEFTGRHRFRRCWARPGTEARPHGAPSLAEQAARRAQADAYRAKLLVGGLDEAVTRAVLYVVTADPVVDQRCALALNAAREQSMHLSPAEFKVVVREQFFILRLEGEAAIEAITTLVPGTDARRDLFTQVTAIIGAGASPTEAEQSRLARLSRLLGGHLVAAA